MADPIAIKDVLTASSPLIKSLVDTFIVPKLEFINKKIGLTVNKYLVPTENHFREYFFRSYKKYSTINTLVFSNSQRLLKDIFIPLTLNLTTDKKIKYKVEGYSYGILGVYNKVLITDTAGMGKSTLMKRIFLDTIDNSICICILIELRRLSKAKTIIQEIHEQLNSLNKEFDETLLVELISKGDFLFILDGYDEIPLNDREVVTSDIQNFISKAGNNKFILTSRPESALSSFGDFQMFTIEPLKKKEAFELLRKYDKQGEISKLLVKKLEESDLRNIDEFLTNPLLVSLLFTAFEHKQAIPFKKHIFYRQVYDANFESHDLTKGNSYIRDKYSNLDVDDFHRILRYIGFTCLKLQKIEYTKDELLSIITRAKEFCAGTNFTESDFLKDLITTVPLFIQDGIYFRWAHKSLQEYFAAQFIFLDAKDHQKNILSKLYDSNADKFYNLFDLYYDIDYKGFRHTIMYFILKDFKIYSDHVYKNLSTIDKDDLYERIELTFWSDSVVFKALPVAKNGFWDDELFNKMFSSVTKDKRINYTEFWGLRQPEKKFNYILALIFHNPKKNLLSIFYKRNDNIMRESRPNRTERKKNALFHFDIQNQYEYIIVDDNKDNVINDPSNFRDINILLGEYALVPIYLVLDKALEELEKIEREIMEEKNNNFLLEGFK